MKRMRKLKIRSIRRQKLKTLMMMKKFPILKSMKMNFSNLKLSTRSEDSLGKMPLSKKGK
jgi:hypothetical protein